MVYVENMMKFMEILLELSYMFSDAAGYKINIEKSMNNWEMNLIKVSNKSEKRCARPVPSILLIIADGN